MRFKRKIGGSAFLQRVLTNVSVNISDDTQVAALTACPHISSFWPTVGHQSIVGVSQVLWPIIGGVSIKYWSILVTCVSEIHW